MSEALYVYHDGSRRLRRVYLIPICIAFGLLIGGILCFTVFCHVGAMESTLWREDRLICTGSQTADGATLFFVRNGSREDYYPKRDALVLLRRLPGGLAADPDAKLEMPIYIPRGQTVAVKVIGPPGAFAIFDANRKYKIALESR